MLARAVRTLVLLFLITPALPAFAQQTGTIIGKVTGLDGSAMPGVTIEARSEVLPGPRVTVTGTDGTYILAALPPGEYTVQFTLSGMQTVSRKTLVLLGQEIAISPKMAVQSIAETVNVTAESSLVDKQSATLANGISQDTFKYLPVGTEYRDLVKLIPGVQYTQEGTRGPSAGGSGQDNVYKFDGVNVTLPLFGTLSAEPAAHDIAQISIVKGGARAIDFDRSGGFTMDSVSRSGTSTYHGQVHYQFQNASMSAAVKNASGASLYEQKRTWWTVNAGGPILKDQLFGYASYYRPETNRENRANAYGELPDYESARNEGFGKLTFTPTRDILLNASFRKSETNSKSRLFGSFTNPSTGTGNESSQRVINADGSWIINATNYLTFKFTNYQNPTQSRPDGESSASVSTALGSTIDINNLDRMGQLTVPSSITGQTAYNAFISPYLSRYGYDCTATLAASLLAAAAAGTTPACNTATVGQRLGGGATGLASTFDKDDFFRTQGQIGYNFTFGDADVKHNVHVGYQRYTDSENLTRSSNGWGTISIPGGRTTCPAACGANAGQAIFFQAAFQQQTTGAVPTIHSEYKSQSFEFNDTINLERFTFNVGIVASNDTMFGQGLKEDKSVLSGYTRSPGTRYKMYEVPWKKMLQPRVSGTWAYNGSDTFFISYAKYNPAASSLPRAASWDRNLATTINAYFNANGALIGTDALASSSGKLFVEDMTPRQINEVSIGTARQFEHGLSGRIYWRYREGSHYWEDTNNTARTAFRTALTPTTVPNALYIADLTARLAQITSGSTYVIAELDNSFTKYYETTAEIDWRKGNANLHGNYTWSHYFGNFDQDNSTTDNDANVFVGSSFIGDGAGRQLWDFREGDLRGDRRHMLKVYGSYQLPWTASIGFYTIAQSGQPWESWSYEPYRTLTTSTDDTSRFSEAAGSRRSAGHYQIDLNYTQRVKFGSKYGLDIKGELFNIMDKQTGYSIDPKVHNAGFGNPRLFFSPRRLNVTATLSF
jgi:hypothetical protein